MNTIRITAALILALLVPATPGFAGVEECYDAYYAADFERAFGVCVKFAGRGDAGAQYKMGRMYHFGEFIPQVYTEAERWYRAAANQGVPLAQHALALLYYEGKGVPQDYVFAHVWFNLAGAQGVEDALSMRDVLANQMTPDQIAEAQRLAREWKPVN